MKGLGGILAILGILLVGLGVVNYFGAFVSVGIPPVNLNFILVALGVVVLAVGGALLMVSRRPRGVPPPPPPPGRAEPTPMPEVGAEPAPMPAPMPEQEGSSHEPLGGDQDQEGEPNREQDRTQ